MPKDTVDKVIENLNKKYRPEGAKEVALRGSEVKPIEIIPASSFSIGYVMGTGGWFAGKLMEFVGHEGSGKTTIALLAMKDIYEYYEGEKAVAFVDLEHRFNPEWARRLGLDVDENLILLQPTTAEDATDMMIDLIKSGSVCAVAFDSIGAATPQKEAQTFNDQSTMYGGAAKVMSRNVKTMASLANLYDVCCFYMNHLRADMSGYNREITPGGHAVKHMMSLRMSIKRGRIDSENKSRFYEKAAEGELQVGFPMIFKVRKNSFAPPDREQWSDFYYTPAPSQDVNEVGFNTRQELERLSMLMGLVQRRGPYYSYKDLQVQGRKNFMEELKNQGLYDDLQKDVQATFMDNFQVDESVLDEDLAKPEEVVPEESKPSTGQERSLRDVLGLDQ